MTAVTTEIGSLYNLIEPCSSAWQLWANSLTSGAYKSGFGVMRDAENAYDPLGVLAAIQDVDWVWDDREEAWTYEGDAYFLPDAQMSLWLGAASPHHMKALQALLQKIADNATLGEIGGWLLEGQRVAERDRMRLRVTRNRTVPYATMTDRVFHHDNIYGRR